jgi:hypothetical protein
MKTLERFRALINSPRGLIFATSIVAKACKVEGPSSGGGESEFLSGSVRSLPHSPD